MIKITEFEVSYINVVGVHCGILKQYQRQSWANHAVD